jgi:RimJ/RimL family protein N-acetyltransferase
MPIPLPIETDRLLIRAVDPEEDSGAMAAVYCDPEVMWLIPEGPLKGVEAVEKELEKHAADQTQRGFSYWAVVERESGRVIGDAGFGIFEETGDIELGYTIARDRWGRGYATEAAAGCLAAGLTHLGVERIVAVIDSRNENSIRVAERIGMERIEEIEAHRRPHLIYAAHALDSRAYPDKSARLSS